MLLCIIPSVTFAHWLPKSETFIGGVGPGCTMGYVASVYGQPAQKKWFNGDGIRGVSYIYSPYFSITSRAGSNDPRPEAETIVVGYSLRNNSLSTPSGLTVGIPYATVKGMYGKADSISNWNGRKGYNYRFPPMGCMTFYVDSNEIITEIYYGTDW